MQILLSTVRLWLQKEIVCVTFFIQDTPKGEMGDNDSEKM